MDALSRAPSVVVLGGPNGAGKSTAAPRLLRGALRVDEFVNADTLAQGLSAFRPEGAAIEAGRVMLQRLNRLARSGKSFAFESTLASTSFARRLVTLRQKGYEVHVVYLWLPSVELAIARVRLRVEAGGHDVPEATIRRRFERGRRNFFERFVPVANHFRVYDASPESGPRIVATGTEGGRPRILDDAVWRQLSEIRHE